MRRGERLLLLALAITSALLRTLAFLRYRFDSDEPQHLHVAWGWTAGLLQYRDVFDNHAPLFHIVTAPILAAVGERDNVLLYMRLPMLLTFAIVVWATYLLARRLYSERVAIWSTVLLTILPPFFLKSVEYRTDNMWNALWCMALVILTGGELTLLRAFATGILLGFAFATSLKTSLLLLTLAAGAIMTAVVFKRGSFGGVIAIAAGVPIVPAAILAYFASRGALSNLGYCVVTFNEILTQTRSPLALWTTRALWLPLMAVAIRIAWRKRPQNDDEVTRWRFFFAFATAFFFITLICFWILISPRDYLPFYPFLVIFGVAWVERRAKRPLMVYAASAVFFIVLIAHYTDRFANHTLEQITMMRQVLGLTRPGEPLMDYKGETVYRRRPSYFIFEYITRNAMHRGLIRDTIAEDIVRSRCYVVQADGDFWPPEANAFLDENFIDVGRLRAAGKLIKVNRTFTISVPGSYALVRKKGEVTSGLLDGLPYRGPRFLAPGPHVFADANERDSTACLWAPALRRGYSPFHLRDRDF